MGQLPEVESSKTNFEVLGLEAQVLGLKAYKSSKMSCPRLEDRIIFWLFKKENNQTKHNITAIVCHFVVSFHCLETK